MRYLLGGVIEAKTYEKLLDILEEMSLLSNFTNNEITKLQFITHRLAIFSSPNVLDEYDRFLQTLKDLSKDANLSNDMVELSEAIGKLTIQIRYDLLNESYSEKEYSKSQIKNLIVNNSDRLSSLKLK